ncbi:hypothetical protein PIB30_005730 [Stylosanthes scabra]|uniref:Uncharacterized protein n=1 Tax=Stylosanthes scabra TaxID=79078 RepID=A0ABU6V5K1_9FABA|nr:hypothetical protein [Stylosanthes scabra]
MQYSPGERLLTDTLMSMSKDEQRPPQEEEVIDISSGSDDDNEPRPQPIKILVPKIEDCLVSSPSSKLIMEVLMSTGDDEVLDPQPEPQPDPSVPSFNLNLGFPTPSGTQDQPPTTLNEEFPLTARIMAVINSMDEHVSGPEPTTATPQPTQAVPKGGNDYEGGYLGNGAKGGERL